MFGKPVSELIRLDAEYRTRKKKRQAALVIGSVIIAAVAAACLYVMGVAYMYHVATHAPTPQHVSQNYRPDLNLCPKEDDAYENPNDKLWECIHNAMWRADI